MRTAFALFLTLAPLVAQTEDSDRPEPAWRRLGLDRSIAWVEDPETFVDARSVKRTLTEDVDRMALMDDAVERAKAEHKLVLWYVYRIVEKSSGGRQMYRAPVLDIYTQQVLFNDPDVAGIIDAHFVPLRMVCDESMAERFDLRPLAVVEPAIVFVDGSGKIVHTVERLRTFDALWFARLLGRVLEVSPVSIADAEAETAGQYERALALLPDDDAPDTAWHRTRLLRRLGRPAQALAAAARAQGPRKVDVPLEIGRILTLWQHHAEAVQHLQSMRATFDDAASELTYLLAVNTLRIGDHAGAKALFTELANSTADDMFAARARANVELGNDRQPYGASFAGFESFRYLPDAAYRGLPRDTTWAGEALNRDQMIANAVRYLLAQQREDGGFTDSRYAYWPNPEITTNTWVAITALAASALVEHRDTDPDRIDAAVQRAEQFAFAAVNLNRGKNEDVYADAYRLHYLTVQHAHASDAPARARFVQRMATLIREAQARQFDDGFWAHEYKNAFCTGAFMWSALRAREAGADVPIELISKAVHALKSARRDDGGFTYSGPVGTRKFALSDSAGRMPLCESVLFAFGESDPARVRFAFETFWTYMDRIEQVRRNDFHSDGELAGFFFFHSLFHASEAMRFLDDATARATTARRLLELLGRIPELDGSFLDSHEIGRSYGTAMALLVLANLD